MRQSYDAHGYPYNPVKLRANLGFKLGLELGTEFSDEKLEQACETWLQLTSNERRRVALRSSAICRLRMRGESEGLETAISEAAINNEIEHICREEHESEEGQHASANAFFPKIIREELRSRLIDQLGNAFAAEKLDEAYEQWLHQTREERDRERERSEAIARLRSRLESGNASELAEVEIEAELHRMRQEDKARSLEHTRATIVEAEKKRIEQRNVTLFWCAIPALFLLYIVGVAVFQGARSSYSRDSDVDRIYRSQFNSEDERLEFEAQMEAEDELRRDAPVGQTRGGDTF